jgi:rhomboid family GlyGly-CTERM serine protease
MKHLPILTFFLAGLALAIHASPTATAALQFEREAIFRGELWRVFSGHLTHFGVDHLRWDVIALLAFGSLAEMRARVGFILCVTVSALVISLGVAFFQPQFAIYRGLSGIDSALFGLVTVDLLRTGWRERDRLMTACGALALAGFLAKSAYELITGTAFFVDADASFEAVPLAHLLGAIVGGACVGTTKTEQARTVVTV